MALLPKSCERALLERFLKAEAMALWSVRAAQLERVPGHVATFLRRHEADEHEHLQRFEAMLGRQSWGRAAAPAVPRQWAALAVHLYGYETLGLEFAKLLAALRPDLSSIVEDEEAHVGFFERELQRMLSGDDPRAEEARRSARSWWKKVPRTLDRYLGAAELRPFRAELRHTILEAIEGRFRCLGLFDGEQQGPGSVRPESQPSR